MTRINHENTMLLTLFTPRVRYLGWTNIDWNENEIPHKENILFFMYTYFDLGVVHCCKTFEIPMIPLELTKKICDYLYPVKPSISYAYYFWYWLYLDQLFHFYSSDEYGLLVYAEDYTYKYGVTSVRLYRIQEKINKCYKMIRQ